MAAVSRRKQSKPQRLVEPIGNDRNHNIEIGNEEKDTIKEPNTDSSDSLDSHVCGRCCAQFFRVNEFMEHKQRCKKEWPWKGTDSAEPNKPDPDGAVDLSQKNQKTQENGTEVKKLKHALTTLEEQQAFQLQLLEQIYNQVQPNNDTIPSNTSFLLSPPNSNETCSDSKINCELCDRVLPNKASFLWHIMGEHMAERPFACDQCPHRFNKRTDLRVHVQQTHSLAMELRQSRPRSTHPDVMSPCEMEQDRQSAPPLNHSADWDLFNISTSPNRYSTGSSPWNQQEPVTPFSETSSASHSPKLTNEPTIFKDRPLDLSLSGLFPMPSTQPLGSGPVKPLAFPSYAAHLPPTVTPPVSCQSNALCNDDDWESMMEVSQTDEMEQIRQLVGDKPRPLPTDPNQCLICRRILSCKSALQMHYRTHTGERPFKCKICMRAFTTKGNLKTHMGVHRAKHPFRGTSAGLYHQCPICQKRFFSIPLLQQHITLHTNHLRTGLPAMPIIPAQKPQITEVVPEVRAKTPIKCDSPSPAPKLSIVEDPPMPLLNSVLPHVSISQSLSLPDRNPFSSIILPTPEQRFFMAGRPNTTCNICLKVFACYSALEIHYRSHTKDRPFKCNACGRGFSTKGNMKQHLLTHKIRDMSNADPTSRASSAASLTQTTESFSPTTSIISEQNMDKNVDMKEFTNDLPLVTNQEENEVPAQPGPSPLESIKKMWSQTEPPPPRKAPILSKHQCGVCFKHFSSSSALQIHMRTHTGDKPFKCNICTRAFTTRGNLKVHMGTHVWHNPSRRGRRIFDFPNSNGNDDYGEENMPSNPNPTQCAEVESPIKQSNLRLPGSNSGIFQPFIPTLPFSPSSMGTPGFVSPISGGFPNFSPPMMPPTPASLGICSTTPSPMTSPPSSMAGGQNPVEAMMWMWRTVCSVCQKMCSSPMELEEHLKEHLHIPASRRNSENSAPLLN